MIGVVEGAVFGRKFVGVLVGIGTTEGRSRKCHFASFKIARIITHPKKIGNIANGHNASILRKDH